MDWYLSRAVGGVGVMTAPLVAVVIPYARFLECQDRRRRLAAGLPPPDQPPTIDAEITVAGEMAVVLNRQ